MTHTCPVCLVGQIKVAAVVTCSPECRAEWRNYRSGAIRMLALSQAEDLDHKALDSRIAKLREE